MILADENIDTRLIDTLRANNIDVYAIREKNPGVEDEEVIEISKNPPRIILTRDKDFGEWVFAHQVTDISVIFLRYGFKDRQKIIEIVKNLILKQKDYLVGRFTTVRIDKIRSTPLK